MLDVGQGCISLNQDYELGKETPVRLHIIFSNFLQFSAKKIRTYRVVRAFPYFISSCWILRS